MDDISKQSLFSRSLLNEGKAGAYYTDPEHCKWIGEMFQFPTEEVCCLEPSIGNAVAIKNVTQAAENTKIFGVELNSDTVRQLQQQQEDIQLLEADFLNGVKISHNSFSFCFSNPPYGIDESMNKQRYEKLFLEKLTPYMTNGAVLVYVIPYYVFHEESIMKSIFARYQILNVYRFHEKEFKKFQQVVIIGRKKKNLGFLRDDFDAYFQTVNELEKIPELPMQYTGDKIEVYPSSSRNIEYFCSKEFHPEKAFSFLSKSPLYKPFGKAIETKEYTNNRIDNPPIPLKKDMLYLLAVSGGGQGLAGNEENGDLHLQRGTVKRIQTRTIEPRGEDSMKEVVRESSAICLTIIESSGKITHFEN